MINLYKNNSKRALRISFMSKHKRIYIYLNVRNLKNNVVEFVKKCIKNMIIIIIMYANTL